MWLSSSTSDGRLQVWLTCPRFFLIVLILFPFFNTFRSLVRNTFPMLSTQAFGDGHSPLKRWIMHLTRSKSAALFGFFQSWSMGFILHALLRRHSVHYDWASNKWSHQRLGNQQAECGQFATRWCTQRLCRVKNRTFNFLFLFSLSFRKAFFLIFK